MNKKTSVRRFPILFVMGVMSIAMLLSVAGSLVLPVPAYAQGETYLLYYPEDEATKQKLKDVYGKSGSDKFNSPVLENVSILASGGTLFGDEPQRLVYDRDVNKALNEGTGFGGQKDNNGDEQFFSRVYYCDEKTGQRGYSEPATSNGSNPYYRITYVVALPDMDSAGKLFDVKIHNKTAVGATKILKITPGQDGPTGQPGVESKTETIKDLSSGDGVGELDNDINKISNAACRPSPIGENKVDVKNYYTAATAAEKAAVASLLDVANSGAANPSAGGGPGDTSAPGLECNASFFNPLTWLLCPAVKGMVNIVGAIDDIITSQLSVGTSGNTSDPNQIFCKGASTAGTCGAYENAWRSVRNIALGLMVIAGLIIVIAQALGMEILDAYAIRKTLPRLIIAAVAITLSWELMRLLVTFTNDLGYGIRFLIYRPFIESGLNNATLGGGGTVATSLAAGVAVSALGIFGLLSFAATAALAVFVAFIVLIIRQLLIIILIIFAPIAIFAYILPNTQGIYKVWWGTFSKALLMFPIIVAFIAAGRVFSAIATTSQGTLGELIGFAAYFAPYFLLPLTFRFAGGALANIGGFVNDKGKGGFDRLKKYRGGQYQTHGARKIEGAGRQVLAKRSLVNNSLQDAASRSNNRFTRAALGRSAGVLGGYNLEALQSAKQVQVAKEVNDQIATGRDDEIRGLLVDKKGATEANGRMRIQGGKKQYRSLGGAWVDEAHVDAGQRRWGNDRYAKQAALSYEMRKTDSIEDVESLKQNYASVARASGMKDGEAAGAWIGSAFENQGQHLELKHTNWETGRMDAGNASKFASEAFEKKGSYQMAQMHASTIKQLGVANQLAANDNDSQRGNRTQTQIAGVAETFVSRYGGGGGGSGGEDPERAAAFARQQLQSGGQTPSGGQQVITTNTPGAGNVATEVRKLAVETGVLQPLDPSTNTQPHVDPPAIGRQN